MENEIDPPMAREDTDKDKEAEDLVSEPNNSNKKRNYDVHPGV